MNKKTLFLALLSAAVSAGALAAPAPARGVLGGEGPIDFTGGANSEISNESCRVLLTNPARVSQGLARLTARNIVLTGRKTGGECAFDHVEATGQVIYITPEQRLRADKAVYDERGVNATFTGDVVYVRGQDVGTAPEVIVNTTTGEIKLPGGVRGVIPPRAQ